MCRVPHAAARRSAAYLSDVAILVEKIIGLSGKLAKKEENT